MKKYRTNLTFGSVDNKNILEPEDDAAHINWGGKWRMPNIYELEELFTRCKWTYTELNGVAGYLVMGINGNSIFFPKSGYYSDDYVDYSRACYLWSILAIFWLTCINLCDDFKIQVL